jgi:NADPH:quinone reductase-like Zn-dependent oxidoreductase
MKLLMRIFKWLAALLLLILVLLIGAIFIGYWRSDNDCGQQSSTPRDPMSAVVYCDYGAPDVLHLEQIEKPIPNDNQVLIKVHAASVNPLDWHFMRGVPYLIRAESGLRRPKSRRLGTDVAGEIAAVGKNVSAYKVGDQVFGACVGAFAEYCVSKSNLAAKPANVTYEQAAGVPIAGITALQALRDRGHLQAGQKVLINGASGGVGTFAVQLAKNMGAHVTGVCSGRSIEMVRALGADRVIDYTKDDFTKGAERYDLILDCVGTQPLSGFKRALKPHGICVLIGGGSPEEGKWLGPMTRPLKALFLAPFMSQKMSMFMAAIKKDDLQTLADLMQSGKVKPVIDRTYNLAQVVEAMRYVEKGHAHGKVIVTVGSAAVASASK